MSEVKKIDITPREIVMTALEHKTPPRVPFSLGFGVNPPAKLRLMDYLGHKNLRQTDDFLIQFDDIRRPGLPYIGPADRNRRLPDGRVVDIWGVIRAPVTYSENGIYDEICH